MPRRYRRRSARSAPAAVLERPEQFATAAFPSAVRERDPHRYDTARIVARTDVPTLLAWGRDLELDAKNEAIRPAMFSQLEVRPDWYGVANGDEVLRLTDWPEGRRLADAYRRELPEVRLPSLRRRRVWRDAGEEFDRDRFDAGLDDCWSTRSRATVPNGGSLTMTVQVGGLADVDAADLAWTGAAAVAVIDAAEAAGLRLDVTAASTSCNTFPGLSDETTVLIDVKRASDPVDPASLVLALASPAFFRWHGIKSRATLPWKVSKGFGSTSPTPADLRGELHLPQVRSRESAAREVDRIARQLLDLAGTNATLAA